MQKFILNFTWARNPSDAHKINEYTYDSLNAMLEAARDFAQREDITILGYEVKEVELQPIQL